LTTLIDRPILGPGRFVAAAGLQSIAPDRKGVANTKDA
jgi:hypothetical protein